MRKQETNKQLKIKRDHILKKQMKGTLNTQASFSPSYMNSWGTLYNTSTPMLRLLGIQHLGYNNFTAYVHSSIAYTRQQIKAK
jgi:hypothetical protein